MKRSSKHTGMAIWLTGLPCSGKSTIAKLLAFELRGQDRLVEVLDGDEIRQYLTRGLGFSKEDRNENIRRVAYVAKLLARNGVIAIVATISPYRETREEARKLIDQFVEVYVKCPLEICQARDVKGMYRKALAGELANFTGVTDPYEAPIDPELILDTARESPEQSVARCLQFLEERKYIV